MTEDFKAGVRAGLLAAAEMLEEDAQRIRAAVTPAAGMRGGYALVSANALSRAAEYVRQLDTDKKAGA